MLTVHSDDGSFVAALNYTEKQNKEGTSKGFWVQFVKRKELSPAQIAEIKALFAEEVSKLFTTTFGDQK